MSARLETVDNPTTIFECQDFVMFIMPWKDNPELVNAVKTLITLMQTEKDPIIVEDKIDEFLDGRFGDVLNQDTRYSGNGIHSLRQIAMGKSLELRPVHCRGVSDRSGKKG
jgi:hypothetical protein